MRQPSTSLRGSANERSGFTAGSPSHTGVAEANGLNIRTVRPLMTNSDHANFAQAGIPALRLVAGFDDPAAHLRVVLTPADTRDKVGQGETDIPAREMLADMLLELNRPQEALVEFGLALKLSPNRFNALYNAGMAAEALGDEAQAKSYYAALLESTDNGSRSARPEFDHVRTFASSRALAEK